ncbi:MAG: hypothetical protein WBD37_04765, partial [Anderseniella sp.]
MMIDAGHTHRNKADLRRLLDQRDAEIARQSAELLARDLLIEKLKLQLSKIGGNGSVPSPKCWT